jgi:hypothetical protein
MNVIGPSSGSYEWDQEYVERMQAAYGRHSVEARRAEATRNFGAWQRGEFTPTAEGFMPRPRRSVWARILTWLRH